MNSLKVDLIQANTNPIKMANFITKTVNNSFRQKVLNLLLSDDRLSVNELCDKLKTEQSVMSQHLAILRKAGLVNTEREGKRIFYSVNQDYLQDTINTILHLTREVAK
jgi:DNA-binding transcriptional ArsR family regulator